MTSIIDSHTPVDPVEVTTRKTLTNGFILRKLVWSVALLGMVIAAANGLFTFEMQTGAPQQAAAAAASCFHMMTVYVMARALDQLFRNQEALG